MNYKIKHVDLIVDDDDDDDDDDAIARKFENCDKERIFLEQKKMSLRHHFAVSVFHV